MIYIINKNKHYSNNIIPILTCKNIIKGTFKFIGDIYYEDSSKNINTNKLFGFSDNWYHHWDSLRIGWRVPLINKNQVIQNIELMSIIYNNGNRIIKPLLFINPNIEYKFELGVKGNKYYIEIDGYYFEFDRNSEYNFIRYILKPYFGGNDKTKKQFKIEIKHKFI